MADQKVEQYKLRCPKGMKLPSAVKIAAAMMNRSKEDKNFFMRSMGIAIHEAAYKVKNAQRDQAAKNAKPAPGIPSSGPDTE